MEKEQSMSPTPKIEVKDAEVKEVEKEKILLDFPMAIKAILEKKKVSKLEWSNREIYGVLNNGTLCLHKDDGKEYQWILNDGDMSGEDYILV